MRVNFKLIDNSRLIASKAMFEASLEKAKLNQKYWDELLEKLRKSGGGGGGDDPHFDRIAVSMMLSNFLSNKKIQAMLRNFTSEFLNTDKNVLKQLQITNQNIFVNVIQKVGNVILNGITNMISLIVCRVAPLGRLYNDVVNKLSSFVMILSFQLNKLKELLEEEFKEAVRKLDVTEKINKVKDFFMDLLTSCLPILKISSSFNQHRYSTNHTIKSH
ncbi:MAG: hypothetical protein HYY52_08465 [Candidatus Melainabacteria bacterium]|nr:hypothetical protein [Candidatus Melainabacteria bacterium]